VYSREKGVLTPRLEVWSRQPEHGPPLLFRNPCRLASYRDSRSNSPAAPERIAIAVVAPKTSACSKGLA